MKDKKTLRKEILAKRDMFTREEIDLMSELIFEKVKKLYCFQQADTIMVYVSYGKELNTFNFIRDCINMGKRVVTPICKPDKTMDLALTKNFPEGFVTTKTGIPEIPKDKAELIPPQELDLVITPGLAFTYSGDRLGYGGGFYDRMFEILEPNVVKLCPSFDEFVLDEVPTDEHDTPVDIIITPTMSIFCGKRSEENTDFYAMD